MQNAHKITEMLGADLKVLQIQALQDFYHGKDSMILLPTGHDKSVIYLLTPFLCAAMNSYISAISEVKYTSLILSILNSVMKNQVHALCSKGLPACYLLFLKCFFFLICFNFFFFFLITCLLSWYQITLWKHIYFKIGWWWYM